MSRIAKLGLLLLPACVATPTSSVESEIVGGQIAHTADFPTVVALEDGPGNWFCTGTLIDAQWVLTAAHCVEGETATKLKIRFNDDNINDTTGGTEVAVAEIHENPGYDGVAWDNDIALIKLMAPVAGVTPTPVHRTAPAPGTQVIQVGYGATSDQDQVAGVLHQLTTPTIDCATVGDPTVMSANVVCFDQRDGNGTCYGDSGGPSFVDLGGGQYEVAAITSGGTVDSCMAGFDIQTSVAGEIAFVDMIMGNTDPTDPTDPMNPTDPTNPTDPMNPSDDGGSDGGCNAGGSAGLLIGAFGMLLRRRRRR